MICSHCGFSNDTSEHRCARCGRPLQLRLGAHWRRSGLESDSPLASLPPSGLSEPPPPRQPLWKQELNRKIEGYRDRQKVSEETRAQTSAQPHAGREEAVSRERAENRSEPAPGRMAAAAGAGASRRMLPLGTAPVGPAGPKPRVDPNWRRVTPPPGSPQSQQLPPLSKHQNGASKTEQLASEKRNGSAMQEAPAAERSHKDAVKPRPANSPPRQGDEVAAAAPIAPLAIRAVAGVLDFSIIVVAVGLFLSVFYMMGGVVLTDLEGVRSIAMTFLAIVCFYWVFYVGFLGGTSGMNWLGLRVLNFDGQPPTGAQRRTRALGTILSTLSLGLGFAWSVADEEKLTWHDRMSKTFVTRDGSIGFRARASKQNAGGKRLPELRGTRA